MSSGDHTGGGVRKKAKTEAPMAVLRPPAAAGAPAFTEAPVVQGQAVQGLGRVRVGRCTFDSKGKRTDPTWPGFTPILVLMKTHSKWGVLGPHELRDEGTGAIMENSWQFSKVYASVPATKQVRSRWDPTVIWEHAAERHVDAAGCLTPAHIAWRAKGLAAPVAVRYPVGFGGRHACLYALRPGDAQAPGPVPPHAKLDYIAARKALYVPEYHRLVTKHPLFRELVTRLHRGENLLLIEVDGPHQESMPYYQATYSVGDTFVEHGSVEATPEHLDLLLNDARHPYGHGYCLASALLMECAKAAPVAPVPPATPS